LFTLLFAGCALKSRDIGADLSNIRVNQVGYLSKGVKQAIIPTPEIDSFYVEDKKGKVYFEGSILPTKYWDKSDEHVAVADFSTLSDKGSFRVVSGTKTSPFFEINDQPYLELLKGAAKSYFYNRASSTLDRKYSGDYHRSYSHPDTAVYVHASAASVLRPEGTKISSSFGWYDAGDYNKYVVNSGITLYTLLLAYEQNTALFDTLTWNIPESENDQADLMDEIMWNVKWMEQMQDPEDGGVYHKTTTVAFEAFVPASEATGKRYVVAKSTAATLDFASIMSKLSVIIRDRDPKYAQSILDKAELAWRWAEEHPNVTFKNPVSHSDVPAVSTGEYGDSELRDEFFWAASELYLATMKKYYEERIELNVFENFRTPSWPDVESLALISIASTNQPINDKLKKAAADKLMSLSEKLTQQWVNAPYKITLNDFVWGSNAVILNQAMILTNAYRFFGNKEFYDAALSGLDYVLGRNATDYCFVTGFGTLSPKNIHHRQSASDEVAEPVPGFLVGGPNPRNVHQDCGSKRYRYKQPARCYLDETCSYSTNEVAINWNAPLVYLTSTLQTIYQNDFE